MIGIIGAMAEEVSAFLQHMTDRQTSQIACIDFHQGTLAGVKVVVAQSGIGKVNAAMTTTLLCDHFQPQYLINTGSAGGLNPAQKVGDIIVSVNVLHHDVDVSAFGYALGQVPGQPATYAAQAHLVAIAEDSLKTLGLTAYRGQIASGDQFMTRADHIAYVRRHFPQVDAVEMEGAAIAQVAYRFGIPFVIIRALSDIAGSESPISFEQFLPLAANNAARLIMTMLPRMLSS